MHPLHSSSPPPHEDGTQIGRTPEIEVPYGGSARLEWTDSSGVQDTEIDRSLVIGNSQNADVRIEDPTVSRLHAELTLREDGVWIRDLSSKNGTMVMGLRVEQARVPHLGRIRVGGTELTVKHGRAAPANSAQVWASDRFQLMVGGSRKMRELYAKLARVAGSPASVLIGGETGTGKELVARSLHAASPRASGPFVVVDCAALPEHLLDAELFGHARGAFTGAVGSRAGAIESANGGTVFLDEVGELPKSMQPKLLRVLEARTVRRIGENEHKSVDVRFVSATHRDLLNMVSLGEFREDLYFRLGVIPVTVPALRDRLEDLATLIAHFAGPSLNLTPELLGQLQERHWAGNVRELRNFVERMIALGSQEALELTASRPSLVNLEAQAPVSQRRLPAPSTANLEVDALPTLGPFRVYREQWIDKVEKHYVNQLLTRHGQNVPAAAREAELDRTYLYKLIRKHGR